MFPIAVRQHDFVTPPRAFGPTGPAGQMVAVTVSPSSKYIDLSALSFQQTYDATSAQTQDARTGIVGHYVTIYADGCDVGIIFGKTAGVVSGGAAPSLSAVGTMSASGTYSTATGACYRIPSGTKERFLTQAGQDLFMGYVATATGTMRVYQSSPSNP